MKLKKETPPKKPERPRKKSERDEIVMVFPESLTLPDAVWQHLSFPQEVGNPFAASSAGQPVTFYLHQGHLCLALTHSLAALRSPTTTNIFRGPGGGHHQSSFCVVLGVSHDELQKILGRPRGKHKTEPPHDLEHLEELLLLVRQEVTGNPTWGGVKTWLYQELLGLGMQAPISFIRNGQWREVSNLVIGNSYGMY